MVLLSHTELVLDEFLLVLSSSLLSSISLGNELKLIDMLWRLDDDDLRLRRRRLGTKIFL